MRKGGKAPREKGKGKRSDHSRGKGETREEEISRRVVKIVRHFSKGIRAMDGSVTKEGNKKYIEYPKTPPVPT